jgi:hypothetical protein
LLGNGSVNMFLWQLIHTEQHSNCWNACASEGQQQFTTQKRQAQSESRERKIWVMCLNRAQNQELLCWQRPSADYQTTLHQTRGAVWHNKCCNYSERPTTPILSKNKQCVSLRSSKQVARVWYNQTFVYPQRKKPTGVKSGDFASVWQNFQGS